jgi:hypothetical protein
VTRGQRLERERARYRNWKRQIEAGERGSREVPEEREGGKREGGIEGRGREAKEREGGREPLFARPWQRIH